MRPLQHPLSPEEPPDRLGAVAWLESASLASAARGSEVKKLSYQTRDPTLRAALRLQAEQHFNDSSAYAMIAASLLLPPVKKPVSKWRRFLIWLATLGA